MYTGCKQGVVPHAPDACSGVLPARSMAVSAHAPMRPCAHAPQNQEWAQAQTILHSIPEIHDDEKTLQVRAQAGRGFGGLG